MDKQAYLRQIDGVIAAGRFKDTWESLCGYEIPKWYKDAKFGIFIHWGVYSVPAFGSEWYPRNMYQKDSREYTHHIETYGVDIERGQSENIRPLLWQNDTAIAKNSWGYTDGNEFKKSSTFKINSLKTRSFTFESVIDKIGILGSDASVTFRQTDTALEISAPDYIDNGRGTPVCFKIGIV